MHNQLLNRLPQAVPTKQIGNHQLNAVHAVANRAANAENLTAQTTNNSIQFDEIAKINFTDESEEYKQGPDGVRLYGCAAMPIQQPIENTYIE